MLCIFMKNTIPVWVSVTGKQNDLATERISGKVNFSTSTIVLQRHLRLWTCSGPCTKITKKLEIWLGRGKKEDAAIQKLTEKKYPPKSIRGALSNAVPTGQLLQRAPVFYK